MLLSFADAYHVLSIDSALRALGRESPHIPGDGEHGAPPNGPRQHINVQNHRWKQHVKSHPFPVLCVGPLTRGGTPSAVGMKSIFKHRRSSKAEMISRIRLRISFPKQTTGVFVRLVALICRAVNKSESPQQQSPGFKTRESEAKKVKHVVES
jgi:hypothetical protein